MEWIFNQFITTQYNYKSKQEHIEKEYEKFFENERLSRELLIKHLNFNLIKCSNDGDWIDLLKIVSYLPLSQVRMFTGYKFFLNDKKKSSVVKQKKFQFNAFTGYDSELSFKELEENVNNHVIICRGLINKYFDPIEKNIWLNRLAISNFLKLENKKFRVEASSIDFFNLMLDDINKLHDDVKVASDILRFGNS